MITHKLARFIYASLLPASSWHPQHSSTHAYLLIRYTYLYKLPAFLWPSPSYLYSWLRISYFYLCKLPTFSYRYAYLCKSPTCSWPSFYVTSLLIPLARKSPPPLRNFKRLSEVATMPASWTLLMRLRSCFDASISRAERRWRVRYWSLVSADLSRAPLRWLLFSYILSTFFAFVLRTFSVMHVSLIIALDYSLICLITH